MAMTECSACGFPALRPEGHAAFCAAVLAFEAGWRQPGKQGCTVDGCERRHKALGLCNLHYLRSRRSQPVDVSPTSPAAPPAPGVSPGSPGAGLVVDDERQKDDACPSGPVASLPGVATSAVWPPVVDERDGGEGLGPSPLVKANRGACSSVAAVG